MPWSSKMLTSCQRLFRSEPGNICMREFIDNTDFRMPRHNRFCIHVRELGAFVGSHAPGNNFERFSFRDRVRPSVRLKVANHHIPAAALKFIRLVEHLVSLAYACRVTEEDFEFAASAGIQSDRHSSVRKYLNVDAFDRLN